MAAKHHADTKQGLFINERCLGLSTSQYRPNKNVIRTNKLTDYAVTAGTVYCF